MFLGNAYKAMDALRVTSSLHEAIDAFRRRAREAFGDFVFEHVLNTAALE